MWEKSKHKKLLCKFRSDEKTKLHEVTSNKFQAIIDTEARHQKEMASMLMTTGSIQDHDSTKEALGFTEQPALADPALNRQGRSQTLPPLQLFCDLVLKFQ